MFPGVSCAAGGCFRPDLGLFLTVSCCFLQDSDRFLLNSGSQILKENHRFRYDAISDGKTASISFCFPAGSRRIYAGTCRNSPEFQWIWAVSGGIRRSESSPWVVAPINNNNQSTIVYAMLLFDVE